jgi:hypothetical protein
MEQPAGNPAAATRDEAPARSAAVRVPYPSPSSDGFFRPHSGAPEEGPILEERFGESMRRASASAGKAVPRHRRRLFRP